MNLIEEIIHTVRLARQAMPLPGEGISVRRTPSGSTISMEEPESDGEASGLPPAFDVSVSGDSIVVGGGRVHVGTTISHGYSGGSVSAGAGYLWLEMGPTGFPSSPLHISASRPSFFDSATNKFQLVLASISGESGGPYAIEAIHHPSNFYLPMPPQWITGYSAITLQYLTHDVNGVVRWVTPSLCQPQQQQQEE